MWVEIYVRRLYVYPYSEECVIGRRTRELVATEHQEGNRKWMLFLAQGPGRDVHWPVFLLGLFLICGPFFSNPNNYM